jgi:uroporphyrinogen decarboxylase
MDNFWKAMLWQRPDAIPVRVGILPAVWIKYREELDALTRKHPALFGDPGAEKRDYDQVGGTYVEGEHIDVWGCVWSNISHGHESIVTGHPVPTRADVHKLKLPEKDAGFPHGFMYLRLGDLRGFEEIMVDFAEEPAELQMLIDIVLEYNLRQAKLQLAKLGDPQVVWFGDDLGMQTGLAMGAEKWRKYLKPCFKAIYEPYKKAGHYVYMHADGCIHEIIPDLVECGVNVVNPQFRANGLDNLVRVCKGKVCIDLDLDRQLFPFATPDEIDAHVRTAVEALAVPEGGLMVLAEISDDIPLENIEAVFTALEKYSKFLSK